jgi:hypothetical protein
MTTTSRVHEQPVSYPLPTRECLFGMKRSGREGNYVRLLLGLEVCGNVVLRRVFWTQGPHTTACWCLHVNLVNVDTPACEFLTRVGVRPEEGGGDFLLNCRRVRNLHGVIFQNAIIRYSQVLEPVF